MKRLWIVMALTMAVAGLGMAQQAETRGRTTANSETAVKKQGRQLELQSGTQIAAQLENSLDAKHARVGDRITLKTVQAVKENGKVIVPKGAQLIGHVTDVQQQSKSNAGSRIGVVLDRLRTGSTEIPITASILSITQARTSARSANNDSFESDTMTRSSGNARSSSQRSSGGGLLGGVGNTVGGVVNTTTSTVSGTTNAVGNTVGATTNAAGSTTGNLTGSLAGLQITQSSQVSAEGGSTLSLSGRNLRLESGTTFNLAINGSTHVGDN